MTTPNFTSEPKTPIEIIASIVTGKNALFGYGHFHASNMADKTTLTNTIEDLTCCYPIDELDAITVIDALTHK